MVREPGSSNSPEEGTEIDAEGSGLPGESPRQVAVKAPEEGLRPTFILLGKLTGIGWFVAGCVVLGAFGGYWIDGWLGTKPWFAVGGVVIGAAAAFTGMIRLLSSLSRSGKERETP